MGKGYEENQERQQAVSMLGKDLARRAKSKCELTGKSGVPLSIYEIPKVPKEPDINRCLMICDAAREQIENPKKMLADDWRHLAESAWSDLPSLQVMSVRILQHLSQEHAWAQAIIDDLYLDDETQEWIDEAPIA